MLVDRGMAYDDDLEQLRDPAYHSLLRPDKAVGRL
jgi:hypothetical protein